MQNFETKAKIFEYATLNKKLTLISHMTLLCLIQKFRCVKFKVLSTKLLSFVGVLPEEVRPSTNSINVSVKYLDVSNLEMRNYYLCCKNRFEKALTPLYFHNFDKEIAIPNLYLLMRKKSYFSFAKFYGITHNCQPSGNAEDNLFSLPCNGGFWS